MSSFIRVFQRLPTVYTSFGRGYAAPAAAASPAEHGGPKELKLTLASPVKAIYSNTTVKQIDVPGMASNMGILPVHVPTIAMLKPGVLSVYEEDGKVSKFFVSSGSLSMNIDGSCQILVEECASLDELDSNVAKQLIDEANKKSLDSTATDVQKAEAGIEIEVANEVLKAAGGGGAGH
ncbi:unnamed protein product [Meloidogyne enterolobii]|uniref:Uncharacterized protein n=1 Tax=Meloidogyne enterolobii TaxID=390850 RepID=A0ACB1AEB9_MELEN